MICIVKARHWQGNESFSSSQRRSMILRVKKPGIAQDCNGSIKWPVGNAYYSG